MPENTPLNLNVTREELSGIIEEAAHKAAKSVNLSAHLDVINARLGSLEGALVDHMDEETEQMKRAVSEGIVEGLRRVALDDVKAGDDIKELRGLLAAWNDVKAAIWNKVKHIIAVVILGGMAFIVSKFTGVNFTGN